MGKTIAGELVKLANQSGFDAVKCSYQGNFLIRGYGNYGNVDANFWLLWAFIAVTARPKQNHSGNSDGEVFFCFPKVLRILYKELATQL